MFDGYCFILINNDILECELKDNIYWHGGAKTRIVENVDSPMDCCKLCKKDADCTKFSYGKVGQHYSKKCYLKKGGTEDFLRGKYFISSRMDISGCGCGGRHQTPL